MRCIFCSMCSYVVNFFFLYAATSLNEPEINDINNKLDFLVLGLSFIPVVSFASFFISFPTLLGSYVSDETEPSQNNSKML